MQEQRTPPLEIVDRIVIAESGCWEWQRRLLKGGYGTFRGTTAHRWVYIRVLGPVAPGLVIDHLCRNRACVNPDHLEAVTQLENIRRGVGHGKETHCPQGHAYDEANTRWRARGSGRDCRACDRERYHRLKAA